MKTFIHNRILDLLIWISRKRGKFLFKQWVILEGKKEKIFKAAETDDFPDALLDFVSAALGVSSKWFEQAHWEKVVLAFYVSLARYTKLSLPMITPTSENFKEESWSYDGRTWHLYSHLLAKEYGWSLEYISRLQVDEALAKIQEIMTDNQLDREFYYGLSEIAYPYNPQTKKSHFKPLQRPHWMREKIQPVPRFKISSEYMPMGVVMMDNVLPEEYLPKTLN